MMGSGDEILSIEVEGVTESASKMTGTALYVDSSAREILFEMDEGGVVTVKASTSTQYVDAPGGSLSLKTMRVGDTLIVYGNYSGGDFEASLIIRE